MPQASLMGLQVPSRAGVKSECGFTRLMALVLLAAVNEQINNSARAILLSCCFCFLLTQEVRDELSQFLTHKTR